ncbi:MAG: hypothetical protein QOJ50_3059, partial [Cryptosporangiaceae bacterium]|nr:hypothetical protein [Cryptosporangiaceae bacterium]
VLALGELASRNPAAHDTAARNLAAHDTAAHGSATADLTAELHGLLHDEDPQLRLAAVHALAAAEPAAASRELGTLIEAVLRDDAAGWQSSAWIGGARETIVHATGQLLRRDPVAAAAFTIGAGRSPDAGQRIAALGLAAGLLAEWRTVAATVLPYAGGQLEAAEAEARYRAAYVLGCLGAEGAAYAGRLAELSGDEAGRDSRLCYTVGDAAVWALARQHDPRCLPGLSGRLTGDRLGFDDRSSHSPRDAPAFWFSQPGLAETLAPLRAHAPDLVAPVLARIAATPDVLLAAQLCDVLAGWGPASARAVPDLLGLLADDERWPAAARALGGIGPAAAPAAAALRRRAEADPRESVAAWAHWRATADPDLALTVLLPMLGDEAGRPALSQLADLGAHAVSAEPRLRLLAGSTGEWIRVEAARTHWRVSGDPALAVRVLTGLARPLVDGRCLPISQVALRYLADIGAPAAPAVPIAEAVLASPRRLSYFGSWRAFTEDEDLRTSAAALAALAR